MFSRKPPPPEIPEEMTEIWSCESDDCNCWMRAGFTFEDEPSCAVCGSPMQRTVRMLPQLSNELSDMRFSGKR